MTYEASKQNLEPTRDTIELNQKPWRGSLGISLCHRLVGEDIVVAGDFGEAVVAPTAELPGCDVLALECKDTEASILPELAIELRHLISQTYCWLGAETNAIGAITSDLGYGVDEKILRHKERNNFVLIGVPEDG